MSDRGVADQEPDPRESRRGLVLMADRSDEADAITELLRSESLSVLTCDAIALPERAARADPVAIVVDLEQANVRAALERIQEQRVGDDPELDCVLVLLGTPALVGEMGLAEHQDVEVLTRPVAPKALITILRKRLGYASAPERSNPSSMGSAPYDSAAILSDFPAIAGLPEVAGILPELGGPLAAPAAAKLSPEIEALLSTSAQRVAESDPDVGAASPPADVPVPPEMMAMVEELLSPESPPQTEGRMDLAAILQPFSGRPGSAPPAPSIEDEQSYDSFNLPPSAQTAPGSSSRGVTDVPKTGARTNIAEEKTNVPAPGTMVGHQAGPLGPHGTVTPQQSGAPPHTGIGPSVASSAPPVTTPGYHAAQDWNPRPGAHSTRNAPTPGFPHGQQPPSAQSFPSGQSFPTGQGFPSGRQGFASAPHGQGPPQAPYPSAQGLPPGWRPAPGGMPPSSDMATHPGSGMAVSTTRHPHRFPTDTPPTAPRRQSTQPPRSGPPRGGPSSDRPPESVGHPLARYGPQAIRGSAIRDSAIRDSAIRDSALPRTAAYEPLPDPAAAMPDHGDPIVLLAQAVSRRATGSLVLSDAQGSIVRRVLMRDGDVSNAASEHPDDALVEFLVERGDLRPEVARMRSVRLPQTGRHAAAALIANGLLSQDDLWPVLRAHAEWILGRALVVRPSQCHLEDEPPERLRAEPNVFGGAAGVEVLVESVRRVLSPDEALDRLGGSQTVIAEGSNLALLSESALDAEDSQLVRHAPGQTVGNLVADRGPGLGPVLVALSALGIVSIQPRRRGPSAAPTADGIDPLDVDAVRERVQARMALVHEADYFGLLGLPSSATGYDIRRAYLELRRTFEPNRLITAATLDLRDDAELIVDVLDEAYEILRDPQRRARYRRAIEATRRP